MKKLLFIFLFPFLSLSFMSCDNQNDDTDSGLYSVSGVWVSVLSEYDGVSDDTVGDEVWVLNSDGTGYHTDLDDYQSGDYATGDSAVRYSFSREHMVISIWYTDPEEFYGDVPVIYLDDDTMKWNLEAEDRIETWTFRRLESL